MPSSTNKFALLIIVAILAFSFTGCFQEQATPFSVPESTEPVMSGSGDLEQASPDIDPKGHYSSQEDVALYLHLYGKLPENFITKREAADLGWIASEGNLWVVAEGKSIGGDRFGNREKLLPESAGRQYYECDVNYTGGYRGPERLVYSNDGLIYYTADHYQSYEMLYGEVAE
ncbi:MAG: ribonuclease domain-containing protein [Bacillota bacterium]|nr:ribonuclease domain-containing protein [Bacillota bacterium]MDW7678361.1 ribonuclease domain-containing protein [Bacillota bacterium]